MSEHASHGESIHNNEAIENTNMDDSTNTNDNVSISKYLSRNFQMCSIQHISESEHLIPN